MKISDCQQSAIFIPQSHPDGWKKMYGLRNLISHEYFGIDYDMLWEIATVSLPQNIKDLQRMFEEQKKLGSNNE